MVQKVRIFILRICKGAMWAEVRFVRFLKERFLGYRRDFKMKVKGCISKDHDELLRSMGFLKLVGVHFSKTTHTFLNPKNPTKPTPTKRIKVQLFTITLFNLFTPTSQSPSHSLIYSPTLSKIKIKYIYNSINKRLQSIWRGSGSGYIIDTTKRLDI